MNTVQYVFPSFDYLKWNYFKSDNYSKGNKGKKSSKNEAKKIKSDNFIMSNREKSNIAIAIMDKLIFWGTKNYFVL